MIALTLLKTKGLLHRNWERGYYWSLYLPSFPLLCTGFTDPCTFQHWNRWQGIKGFLWNKHKLTLMGCYSNATFHSHRKTNFANQLKRWNTWGSNHCFSVLGPNKKKKVSLCHQSKRKTTRVDMITTLIVQKMKESLHRNVLCKFINNSDMLWLYSELV